MATEKRLMCVDDFKKNLCHYCNTYMSEEPCEPGECWVHDVIAQSDTLDAMEVPCKIGDFVWAIRNFKGKKHPQRGVVSEMFFNKRMELIIVVKYVARGEWGKTVFATDKEAYAAIGERKDNG